MELLIYDDQTFEGLTYTDKAIRGREFQSCTFRKCDFSNSEFSGNKFIDCVFDACNLSMFKLGGSTLNGVTFNGCKMLGINFGECQSFLFSVKFEACNLDYASFMGRKMPKTRFINSSLKEATFSNAILAGASFDHSDLLGTIFNKTDLTEANFVNALNYDINPEINTIKKASFSSHGLAGLLRKYQIKIV